MKRFAVIAAFTTLLASPVAALDLETMSDAERQVFRAEVRAYLLENPEVLMEAIAVLEQRQSEQKVVDDTTLVQINAEALFNDEDSYVGGNPDGDITMVEFLDYRCGYCKRAHPEVTKLIKTDGNIRYIIKEFPILGDQSVLASRFAISTRQNAGDEAYAKVHDALMTFRGDISDTSLRRLATDLGLDADMILDGMNSDEVSAIISANHALGQIMQINGTPSFIVGDQMLRGYVPYDSMMEIVAELRG
ncbi:MAG: DsbA family protein [Paracoccaceae bacterium]